MPVAMCGSALTRPAEFVIVDQLRRPAFEEGLPPFADGPRSNETCAGYPDAARVIR
jgi:hypothetical protein